MFRPLATSGPPAGPPERRGRGGRGGGGSRPGPPGFGAGARAAGVRCRRSARNRVRAAESLAARGALPGAAHVAVAGGGAARGGASGLLVQLRHFRSRHLLAVHQHPRLRRRAVVARLHAHARSREHHGAVPRRTRLRCGALAAGRRTRTLAGRSSCRMAADGMVAGLVPLGLLLALARVFTDGYLARRSCAGVGRLRPQRPAARVRGRSDDARLRRLAAASGAAARADPPLGGGTCALAPLLDASERCARLGGDRAGRHTAG